MMYRFALLILLSFSVLLFAQSPVPDDATLDKIADGFQFVEGPVWHPNGFLIFSDIPGNTVYKWDPATGSTEAFHKPSGNSNGLSLDLQGNVLLCQHGKRRVARLENDGTETALATHYNGKRLNSPNDLAVKSDGSIYFTDPPYGISSGQEELGFYGIYRLTPEGEVILLDKSLNRPNGICFSPDESKLYVNDSQARRIYVWDVKEDLTLENRKLFYTMSGSGSADGMKVDTQGNLYSTGPGGVWIFAPDGTLLDKISVPGQTTNLNWGDADYQTLYITSGKAVYNIRLNAVGAGVEETVGALPKQFELRQNYPNPFNPSTTIAFSLNKPSHVSLSIFNAQGQIIHELASGEFDAGYHEFDWDATDARGAPLASCIYFYQLTLDEHQVTKKMVYIM